MLKFNGWRFQGFEDAKIALIEGIVTGLIKKRPAETRYVGEVGLDAGPRFYISFEHQKHVFRTILECCADAGGTILTVHSVRSAPTVLDMIEKHCPNTAAPSFFTGSLAVSAICSARPPWDAIFLSTPR
nr:TatD family hydrolase [Bradyrhizobium altum]